MYRIWMAHYRTQDQLGKVIYCPGSSDIIVERHLINIDKFKQGILTELRDLITLLDHNILMGEPLDAMGIDLDLNNLDIGTDECSGYGLFHPVDSEKSHGHKLIRHFVKSGHLGMVKLQDGTYSVDQKRAKAWLKSVRRATLMLCGLLHFLCGPPPRGAEVMSWLNTNPPQGRRNIYHRSVVDGKPMLLYSFSLYHKAWRRTGYYKEILRFYPHSLTELYCIITGVVRPAESIILPLASKRKDLDLIALHDVYNTRFFAVGGRALEAKDLSNTIRSFFRRHMGPHPPGLRIYRHFTAVIHRSWIIDDKTAEDKELINLLHCMNGSGGGCTSGIDMKHYALFFKEGRLNTPLAKLAFYICRSSHDYFGVPTFKSLSKFRSEIVQIKQALEG